MFKINESKATYLFNSNKKASFIYLQNPEANNAQEAPEQSSEANQEGVEAIQRNEYQNARNAFRNLPNKQTQLEQKHTEAQRLLQEGNQEIDTPLGRMPIIAYANRLDQSLPRSGGWQLAGLQNNFIAIAIQNETQGSDIYRQTQAMIEGLRGEQARFEQQYASVNNPNTLVSGPLLQNAHRGRLNSQEFAGLQSINRQSNQIDSNLRQMQTVLNQYRELIESTRDQATSEVEIDRMQDLRQTDEISRRGIASSVDVRGDTRGLNEAPWSADTNLDGLMGEVAVSSLNIRDLNGSRVGSLRNGAEVALTGAPVTMRINGVPTKMGRIVGNEEKYVAVGGLNRVETFSPVPQSQPARPQNQSPRNNV